MTEEEKARRALEDLRAEIREAHGVLKDLRQGIKDAHEAFYELTQEAMDKCHKEAMAAIDAAFQRSTEHGIEQIDVRFRRLRRMLEKNRIFPRDDARVMGESEEDYGIFRAELKEAEK